jgi:hypothetical protein
MKGAAALLVLLAAGAITAFVLAFSGSHDAAPDKLKSCVTDAGGHVVRGQENLGFALPDIEAGRLKVARRYRLGQDRAVLLPGAGYALLVLTTPSGPGLSGDVARRAYLRTPEFAVVATEVAPVHGVLEGCVRAEARP